MIRKPSYLAIALAGMIGLAAAISILKWTPEEAPVAAAVVEQPSPTVESKAEPEPAVVATAPVAPEPPASHTAPAVPVPAAVDRTVPDHAFQPESKGYIFYYNSPTHWTPQPLPEVIGEARAPHDKNIRAEIEQAAMLFDVDIRMMKAFARIESGFRPKATTGKYKCLFQLSDWEFAKYWKGDIYDIRDCSIAAARKLATEAAQFEKDVGRRATATEIYCIHQQGYQGCAFHYAAPHQLAWKNMFLTNEGQERGEAWARKAIWGNVPSDIKDKIAGGVEALTSAQFIAIWRERVERFMARKVEPPTHYVEQASGARKPAKAAKTAKAKKKAAVANKAGKKKSKTKVASR